MLETDSKRTRTDRIVNDVFIEPSGIIEKQLRVHFEIVNISVTYGNWSGFDRSKFMEVLPPRVYH